MHVMLLLENREGNSMGHLLMLKLIFFCQANLETCLLSKEQIHSHYCKSFKALSLTSLNILKTSEYVTNYCLF